MNKIFSALTMLVLMPFSGFAISLDALQGNPEKYVKVSENQNSTSYIDADSIKSIRYSPPYYTLQGQTYLIVYGYANILETTVIVNYDNNRSLESLLNQLMDQHPNFTIPQISELSFTMLQRDCGMTLNATHMATYDLDGTLTYESEPEPDLTPIKFLSPYYHAANFMFEKYYGKKFSFSY